MLNALGFLFGAFVWFCVFVAALGGLLVAACVFVISYPVYLLAFIIRKSLCWLIVNEERT